MLGAGAVVILGLVAIFAGTLFKSSPIPKWPGVNVYDGPVRLEPFALVDHHGNVFDNARFKDHWTFLFFGYTHCPDVCPATLGAMKNIHKALSAAPQPVPVQFVFVSVDPHRDTQAVMAEHIQFFHSDFIGVTAKDSATIDQLTQQLGVSYDYEDPADGQLIPNPAALPAGKEYLVNHYASLYLVGPDGRAYADVLPPHQVERVKQVFDTLSNL